MSKFKMIGAALALALSAQACAAGSLIDLGVCKQSNPPPPAAPGLAEQGAAARRSDAANELGTGHGRREYSPAYRVRFERASRVPDEIVALNYDSRSNLIARGVLREPRPFPGFVPDPAGVTLLRHGGHG